MNCRLSKSTVSMTHFLLITAPQLSKKMFMFLQKIIKLIHTLKSFRSKELSPSSYLTMHGLISGGTMSPPHSQIAQKNSNMLYKYKNRENKENRAKCGYLNLWAQST